VSWSLVIKDLAQPHDYLIHYVLSDMDLVVNLLMHYLPRNIVDLIDWGTLKLEPNSNFTSDLSKLVGDFCYSAFFKGTKKTKKIYIFLEHQSSKNYFIPFRFFKYIHVVYQYQEGALEKGQKLRFPFPLGVLLHHGESPWKQTPAMEDLIDKVPGLPSKILDFPIFLIDLARMSMDQLPGHPMICALFDTLQSQSAGVLRKRMPIILDRLSVLRKDKSFKSWVTVLIQYYVSTSHIKSNIIIKEVTRILKEIITKEEAETMAQTVMKTIFLEGRAEGKAEGMAKSVVAFLKSRFGQLPESLQEELMNIKDIDRLNQLIELSATCQSLDEFLEGL
jgi:predicted transposase YdaD